MIKTKKYYKSHRNGLYRAIGIIVCLVYGSIGFAQSVNQQDKTEGLENSTSENQIENGAENNAKQENTQPLALLEATELGILQFSAKSSLYTSNEIIDEFLFKGTTVFWNAKKDTRYAVIASSEELDTLVRLGINTISAYRDLYLGEDAGIVFTPNKDTEVSVTVFSSGVLDGSIKAHDVFQMRKTETNDENGTTQSELSQEKKIDETRKLGNYIVEVYALPSLPDMMNMPFSEEYNMDNQNRIAHRSSKEFRVSLEQDKRVYVRMHSTDFDTLLEVSDRYGRTIISDDWSDNTSLLTFEVPSTDDYYIVASSFDGRREGNYTIESIMSDNEKGEEIAGQITPKSPKVLKKYSSEHSIDLKKGEFLTAEVQALDNDIEVAFVKESLEAVYVETIRKGEKKIIPLYIESEGTYKLLMLSDQKVVSNYILTFYK